MRHLTRGAPLQRLHKVVDGLRCEPGRPAAKGDAKKLGQEARNVVDSWDVGLHVDLDLIQRQSNHRRARSGPSIICLGLAKDEELKGAVRMRHGKADTTVSGVGLPGTI